MDTPNSTVAGQGNAPDVFTYDDEHADSLDSPYRMIYTTVAENGAEEKHSCGCEDLRDAMETACMVFGAGDAFGSVTFRGTPNKLDVIVEGNVVAEIVEN